MGDAGELAWLVEERAIRTVLLRYCRGIDRMDHELVRSCYHDDAIDDHGTFRGTADEYVEWAFRLLAKYESTMHVVANMLIEPADGDTDLAFAETYGIAFHHSADPDPRRNLVIGFRYVDRFERRGGPQEAEWRIAGRVCTTEWVEAPDPE